MADISGLTESIAEGTAMVDEKRLFDSLIYLAFLKGSKIDTVDPTVDDDSDDGHAAGSWWVNTTDKRVFVCVDPSVGAAIWGNVLSGSDTFRVGWALGDLSNGTHHGAGVSEQAITAQDVDSGSSPTINDMNGFKLMVSVTTLTVAGTMRITGTSYDPATGTTTPGDTEDIVIDSTGWYCSAKMWTATITLSDIGGLDIIVDGYRFEPYSSLLPKAILNMVHYSGRAGSGTPSLQVTLYKFDPVAKTFASFFDEIRTPASNTSIHNDRDFNVSLDFPNNEGLYMRMIVTSISDLQFELGFTKA